MFDFLKSKREVPTLPEGTVRRHYQIYGRVQGVGFRYRAKYAAQMLNVTGWVENQDDGTVEIEAQGLPEQIDQIFRIIQQNDFVLISQMRIREMEPDPWERNFCIRGY